VRSAAGRGMRSVVRRHSIAVVRVCLQAATAYEKMRSRQRVLFACENAPDANASHAAPRFSPVVASYPEEKSEWRVQQPGIEAARAVYTSPV